MLTMLFLSLLSSEVIDLGRAVPTVVFFITATLMADGVLIDAVASRIRGKQG